MPSMEDTGSAPPTVTNSKDNVDNDNDHGGGKGARFWVILCALILSLFFAVLEAYSVSPALPVIVSDLRADEFVWVASAYGIASTALLPLSGCLAEVYGRRPIMLISVALFALGGAIAGASQSMNMLIGGRVVQGAGAGGIFTLAQVILSDLVSLKERGTYNGLFGLTWAIAGCVGPIIGGAFAHHTTWRWIFYMTVISSGIVAAIMIAFLRLDKPSSVTLSEALVRLDAIGNTLIIGATCAIVLGLTWGGVVFPWTSYQVLVSICVGGAALLSFLLYEWRFCQYPAVPFYLLSNRTSLSGYAQISLAAFINLTLLCTPRFSFSSLSVPVVNLSAPDYLPVYYQACKDASPTASGVDLLALFVSVGPPTIITGASIAITKRYRPQLWLAWCFILLGLGLLSSVTESTRRAASIGFQVPIGVGIGMIYAAAYFPVLAPLPPTSNAPALALFVFLRTFAQIWGATIGGAVLQNGVQGKLPPSVQATLPGLNNVVYAVVPLIPTMQQPAKDIVRRAFAESFQTVWRILIGVAGAGLIASLGMKALPLHTQRNITLSEAKGKAAEEVAVEEVK
ncbi:MFS general substrate transporter [Ganoderma sinense ZZ0214-1]|uniref:MFS general substrate transporter n=1 Tax=Ganoderma sinense ZZ0214-1 TaxID=1077348 RepID=A0A2G8RSX8_9APHY|nr:MFS general substrate transporter [Ganoderma sinense ZZ0214-1]